VDGAGPYRIVEHGDQQADHHGVNAHQRRLHAGPGAQRVPKGRAPTSSRKRRQENGQQAQQARPAPPPGWITTPSRRRWKTAAPAALGRRHSRPGRYRIDPPGGTHVGLQ
jgi:hypothetical protein